MDFSSDRILEIMYKCNVGILVADKEGIVVWGNEHYESITGLSLAKIIKTNVELIIQEAGTISIKGTAATLRSDVLKEQRTIHRIMSYKNAKDVIVTATPIFGEENTIEWIIYVLVDWDELSELKGQLQKAYEQSEESKLRLQEAILGEILEQYGIIARDKNTLASYSIALRISKVDATVLILGETGTGKERMAKFIHNSGSRSNGLFVHVNCSAIPESLFESELFGYERGSFTGAERTGKMGLIELANEGTLFLDEVAELPLSMQAKLLTVLQNKEIIRVGGSKPQKIDVRIIAATNRDLAEMVEDKTFREDLYYRLNILDIKLPPLRESKDDLVVLVDYFTKKFNQKYHYNKRFSSEVMDIFFDYNWPGNVRELENLVERLIIIATDDIIGVESLPKKFAHIEYSAVPKEGSYKLKPILEEVEAEIIRKVIENTSTLKEAAQELGIELSTLTRKKQKYDIYKSFERENVSNT